MAGVKGNCMRCRAPISCFQRAQSPSSPPLFSLSQPLRLSHWQPWSLGFEVLLFFYSQFTALDSSALTPATDQALIPDTQPQPHAEL